MHVNCILDSFDALAFSGGCDSNSNMSSIKRLVKSEHSDLIDEFTFFHESTSAWSAQTTELAGINTFSDTAI